MDLDLEYHGTRLLEWLYDQPQPQQGVTYFDFTEFTIAEELPEGSDLALAEHLQAQELVRAIRPLTDRPAARITAAGIAHLQGIQARRRDPASLARTLQQRMLQWLYRHEQAAGMDGMAPPDWTGFLGSDGARILGEQFSRAEVEQAASYLSNRNLITAFSIDQVGPGWVRPRLTDEGRDCVLEFSGSTSDYLNRRNGGSVNTYIGNNSGNVAVGSENFTQNVTTGLDTTKVLDFAAAVSQALPVLGLAHDQQSELGDYAVELQAAVGASQPDKGKLRGLIDAIITGLTKAATPLATGIATGLGNDAIRAITGH